MEISNGEILYDSIQRNGICRINNIANIILKDLETRIGRVYFKQEMSSINKIYALIEQGCYPYMEDLLKKHGYDLSVELQYLLVNIGMGAIKDLRIIDKFPSYEMGRIVDNHYLLLTVVGEIDITPLSRYLKDKKVNNFALKYNSHGFCHEATLKFIQENNFYKGITSLIPNQFGERQYHSYVEVEDGYVDFANSIHLSKENFEKIMKPEILSEIHGFDLDRITNSLDEQDLQEEKSQLVRIAVHEQLRRRK